MNGNNIYIALHVALLQLLFIHTKHLYKKINSLFFYIFLFFFFNNISFK